MFRKFHRILIKITLDFSHRKFLFPQNKMNVKDSTWLKQMCLKLESIERKVLSISIELQDIKKMIIDLPEPGASLLTISRNSLFSCRNNVIISLPPNKFKRRRPIHDEMLDLKALDFNDDDFTDCGINPKKPRDDFQRDDQGYVQVYTDGACENNGKPNARAGLGVWFGPNHPLNISKPVSGRATNNVGEIEACTCAINIANNAGVTKLCINTDSQFVINSMTKWIFGWKKHNWKLADGGPVKNKEDFIVLEEAMKLIPDIKWNYVKGHHGIVGNEGADYLAKLGAEKYNKK